SLTIASLGGLRKWWGHHSHTSQSMSQTSGSHHSSGNNTGSTNLSNAMNHGYRHPGMGLLSVAKGGPNGGPSSHLTYSNNQQGP
ncbi:Hypothetical protein FKW44_024950, partial [Caligus rogercresseyi]